MRILEQDASPARKYIFKRLHVPLLFQFKGVYISYHVAMVKTPRSTSLTIHGACFKLFQAWDLSDDQPIEAPKLHDDCFPRFPKKKLMCLRHHVAISLCEVHH